MLAALSILCIGEKVFDWLRLFDRTSFFIHLINQTMKDMVYFLLIFVLGMAMIGLALFILQLNAKPGDPVLIESIYNNFFLDSIRNQYLLSQGVYLNEEFDSHNQHLLLEILFTIAILFTQIVILNMLIAIMGDTFDRVNDRKALFAM